MKKLKILSLAVFPLLLGVMVGCGGNNDPSSSSEKSSESSSRTSTGTTTPAPSSTTTPAPSPSSTTAPTPSSSSEIPTDTAYVSIDGLSHEMIPVDEAAEGLVASFGLTGIDLLGGESVEFMYNSTPITSSIGTDLIEASIYGENNAIITEGETVTIEVKNAATSAAVKFKVWEDGGYSFFITGYEEPEVGFDLLVDDTHIKMEPTDPFEEYDQYSVLEVEVESGSTIAIFDRSTSVTFTPALDEASCDSFTYSSGVISCVTSGKFDFYAKFKFEDDKLYIDKSVEPTPTFVGYEMTLGEETIPLTKTEVIPDDALWIEQYTHAFESIAKGSRIDFYGVPETGEHVKLVEGLGPNPDDLTNKIQNNLKPATVGGVDWTVLADATTVSLYFEVYAYGIGFWLQGGPAIEEGFKLVVGTKQILMEEAEPYEEYTQYKALGVDVAVGEEVSILDLKTGVAFTPALDEASCDSFKYEESKISCTKEGKFDFYAKFKFEDDKLYIGESEVTFDGYSFLFDGEYYELEKQEIKPGDTCLAKYKRNFEHVSAGKRIDFYGDVSDDHILLDKNICPSADDETNKVQNNLKPATKDGVDWTVLQTADNAALYLEVYKDGYSFWLQGGPELRTGFYIKVNGTEFIELVDSKETPEGFEKQVQATEVALAANDTFVIYDAANDTDWVPTLDEYSSENITVVDEHYLVSAEGSYDFYLKLAFGKDMLYVGEHTSPVPVSAPRVMGSFDEWSTGIEMLPVTEGSTEYTAKVDVHALDEIKILNGDGKTYAENWKIEGGDTNAFVRGLASVDGSTKNAVLNFEGTYTLYYETGDTNPGIYLEGTNLPSDYKAVAYLGAEAGGSLPLKVNKVEGDIIEYSRLDVPTSAGPGMGFTAFEIADANGAIDVTLEGGSAAGSFTKNGTKFDYSGSETGLNLYLKYDTKAKTYSIWVDDAHPVAATTVYLKPSIWDVDGAVFYAYFFESGKDPVWVKGVSSGDNYTFDVPEGYTNVVFTRVNPEKNPSVDGWDASVWNQSEDLKVPTNKLVKYTITAWGTDGSKVCKGEWSAL